MLCSGCAKIDKFLHVLLIINELSSKNYFPMQEIEEYDNLLVINNIRFWWFHNCPPIVPQIFRGTNLFSAGLRAGDKNIVHGGQK